MVKMMINSAKSVCSANYWPGIQAGDVKKIDILDRA